MRLWPRARYRRRSYVTFLLNLANPCPLIQTHKLAQKHSVLANPIANNQGQTAVSKHRRIKMVAYPGVMDQPAPEPGLDVMETRRKSSADGAIVG